MYYINVYWPKKPFELVCDGKNIKKIKQKCQIILKA